ncbi:hypothetical protein F2Q69_00015819 [Brassica cretica]|uniref:Aspartic peptidase DDI1-type domain-containing protein n=1 Tax=Brassica cretica TaxID=69181 RepID=A0A8S9R8T6_BRACR|nr:hypothetical protein F2Q69_00015819 [Brassica cretica]
MPSSTRSNEDKHLLFSEDPAHLERTIHKDQRSTLLDAAAFTSTDSYTQPSTDTRPSSSTDLHRSTLIDTTLRTSIDHQSRNMVTIVILRQDENENLHDQDGHMRNVTGQKLDAQGNTMTKIDGWITLTIDRSHLLNRLRSVVQPPPEPLANPPEPTTNPSDTTPEPMKVDEVTEGRRLRKRKEKIPKNLKREANEKEMDGFTKKVLRIPVEKPLMKERMKLRITLKKKSDPEKFAIPCVVKGIEFSHALCDTGTSVSILPKVMADQLGLKIEPSSESFTFVDFSARSSGGIIRDLEHEKLGEGDFEVESSMSFGGSLWCRPMSMDAHRSSHHDEDRSTDYSNHRSTSSVKSTAECCAVRIMTHEEFAEKHPHPPSPFYVKIDRRHEPAVDRQRETDIDRPPSPPIDRRAPLTYRVRLPSIDSDRINALRPTPKPLENPPESTINPSDTTPEPMKVDEATEGRRLRKRKEKIPKNLKREANEKEMYGFTKRVLRIPVEKPFDEVYYTQRLWIFFREAKETEEDIRRIFHHGRERMKLRITLKKKSDPGKFAIPCVVKGIEFPHALCVT